MQWASGILFRRKTSDGEARHGERQPIRLSVTARLPAGEPINIIIENLSVSGFRAISPKALLPGTLLRIALPGGRTPHARVVRNEHGRIGCAFLAPLELAAVRMLTEPAEVY